MAKRGDDTRIMTQVLGGKPSGQVAHHKLRLEVFAGIDAGATVTGKARVLHVGTQAGNTLQLRDDAVSRIHLEVGSTPHGIRVRDLGSTNGTWLVGNIRISDAVVPSGTVVRVGKSQIRIDALEEKVEEAISASPGFGQLLGQSPAMRAIFALLGSVAPTDETVLIVGETGTGKDLCAHSLVAASRRAGKPLVVVDCGAIPPNLLESELFGHVRGAFTGAVSDHRGAFERANGGTIFLDEIGELPLELQTRLLRAVENRTVRRVGGTVDVPLDIRIIAATNRPLEEEVNRSTFRADLYYRLSVVQIRIPPLRERPEDVPLIARHLLNELDIDPASILSAEMVEQLKRGRWPGNVRELRNYLRRVTLGEVGTLHVTEFPQGGEAGYPVDLSLPFREAKEAANARFERAYLTALLERTGGNVSQAARVAQTDRTYLSKLIAKYGIRK